MEIIAHRGYSAIAPENTIPAFTAAVEAAADSVELDVQVTADGVPVAFHDRHTARVTQMPGTIRERTWQQLQSLDVGAWFDPRFAGTTIPSLAAVLPVVAQVPQSIYLDVKPYWDWQEKEVRQLAMLLREVGIEQRCIVYCDNQRFVQQWQQLQTRTMMGSIVTSVDGFLSRLTEATAGEVLISEYRVLLAKPDLVAMARNREMDVVAWTVDSHQEWEQLKAMGISRIVTNVPGDIGL
ncbi:glycerophosphodiester phosphodiesterase family protein [Geitlerinema sp. PCC 9228]|jgi:glycerophosphoryl diester phosphodiesterase|uniref:glycerophosphodiester phosphodiesterase n=1 Tax=Geitlerinema sp. PCC 9228 TaxID=111611 RepID=UPI0008F9D2E6|nr:glycerophosphodiester phosphodiesterase family protein [Geitlerinema sp. PCC 9228]